MCGVIGISGGNSDLVKKANLLLEHRGPDDQGVFIDKFAKIGLGHNRLSIIETSSLGHQPNAPGAHVHHGRRWIVDERGCRAHVEQHVWV